MVRRMQVALIVVVWSYGVLGGSLSAYPQCAQTCLASTILKVCAAEDVGCRCRSVDASIQEEIATCLVGTCSSVEIADTLKVSNNECSAYSSTASVSPSNSAPSSSTPGLVSASTSSKVTTTVSPIQPPSSVTSKVTVPGSSSNATPSKASTSTVLSDALTSLTTRTSTTSTATSSPSSDIGIIPGESVSGLGVGAKAGIAIGVVLVAVLASLAVWLCLRHRKRRIRAHKPEYPGMPELQTVANTHEVDGRGRLEEGQLQDASAYNKARLLYVGAEAELEATPLSEKEEPRTQRPHLLDGQHNRLDEPQNGLPPVELESSKRMSDSGNAGSLSGPSSKTISAESQAGSKLEILRERIGRVRIEKERLTKLQELEELEASLKAEIMAEQRKELEMQRQSDTQGEAI